MSLCLVCPGGDPGYILTCTRRQPHLVHLYYESGRIAPIRPVKMFTAAKTQDAFRLMQKGMHIGRIGLVVRTPMAQEIQIRPE